MKSRTIVLGGGFGGLATANELRRALGAEHEIVVVDRNDGFYAGLRKLWVLVGSGTIEDGTRSREALEARGIHFVRATIEEVDPVARSVRTSAGSYRGDFLVVALGAEPRSDLVSGLDASPDAFDLFSAEGVRAAAPRVRAIERGSVVVCIAGLPYRCPPAPYEASMLLHDHFVTRRVRERIHMTFTTLQAALLPNAGPEGARWIAEELERRGIEHRTAMKLARVEPGALVYDGSELASDLALVVPPHRPPEVIATSALAGDGGWIAVDRGTLATSFPGVFAVGDVTHIPLEGGAALPKAGLFAEAEGLRVARGIVAALEGGPEPRPFDGVGACYLEMGGDEAARVEGAFFADGGPDVRIRERSREGMEEKRRFEVDRLDGWLGMPER